MKKIMHVTQSLLGGTETYFREILWYSSKKYRQILVSPESSSLSEFCTTIGATHLIVEMTRQVKPIKDLNAIIKLCKILKREKPDLVHIHSSKAGIIARIACWLCGVKSVFTPNGVSYLSFSGRKRLLFFFIEGIIKKITHRVLAVSYSESNRLIYEIGFAQSKVFTVLNSITVTEQPNKRELHDKKRFKVGTIARLTPQKNPLLFIDIANEVIQRNKNIDFYILGGGHHDHLQKEVDERIELYGIRNNIHIVSWREQYATESFLQDIDVFLLTSIFEGLPFALLEAMHAGVPCIVTKCDGCNDVIQNAFNGFACMTKYEFGIKILELLGNRDLYGKISEEGQNYIKCNHNSNVNIAQIQEVYDLIIEGH